MEKNNKRKAELVASVEARVLLVAGAENPDGILHVLSKELEDHSYEVFKCNGADGISPHEVKKNRIDIILTEGNLLDPMYVSQHLTQILREMNLPVIMISSNDKNINSHYHWLVGYIVRPILELVEKLFCDRIKKSGEVKRLKEEIKQVELPDEEKRLKEEVEHAELPDEEKLPNEEKRLKEEVEHAELPDQEKLPDEEKRLEEVEHAELPGEENKKKIEREKAGEHHQRMVWAGDRERIFVKIVTELDKNGKATGKKVWEHMQAYGFKDISLKQVNSHLQKHRGKHNKPHSIGNSSQMLGYKDQVETSSEHDTTRHGMKEHSSNTDAPMNTINGNLNTTSTTGNFGNPNICLVEEYYNSHLNGGRYIPSQGENFENGKEKDIIQDWNGINNDFEASFLMMDGTSNMGLEELRMGTPSLQSLQMPVEATPLTIESYTMGGCQSNLLMMDGARNMGLEELRMETPGLQSLQMPVEATPLTIESYTMGGCQSNLLMMDGARNMGLEEVIMGTPGLQCLQMPVEATPLTIESYTMGGCQSNLSMIDGARNTGLEELRMGTPTPGLQSLQLPVEATPLTIESYTMGGCQSNLSMTQGGQPSNLFVCDIQGQAFDNDMPDDHLPEEFKRLDSPINLDVGEFGWSWNEEYIPSQGENEWEDIAQRNNNSNMDDIALEISNHAWGL